MLALMQGGSAISKDLPPFTVARGDNEICGLNTVGLRRAGVSAEDRAELKRLYRFLFLSGYNLRGATLAARARFTSEAARALIDFIAASRRGVCVHVRAGPGKNKAPSGGPEGAGDQAVEDVG
jgi:UDP-N-acetylglucosamine acyltransferase